MDVDRRTILESLSSKDYEGLHLTIALGEDVRSYELKEYRASGQTGVTWLAVDQFGHNWAIKFVYKGDYVHHSLHAEVQRVAQITSEHLAKIFFYGQPSTVNTNFKEFSHCYAVVIEWVHGQSLNSFICEYGSRISLTTCLEITSNLCDVVAELKEHSLTHNDLHAENVMIVRRKSLTAGTERLVVKVIDTGALKDENRRLSLLKKWSDNLEALNSVQTEESSEVRGAARELEERIKWFSRRDEDWIACHLTSLLNCLIARLSALEPADRRFLHNIRPFLNLMLDTNPIRKISDPADIYSGLKDLFEQSRRIDAPPMNTPFDLMSAELIRDDRHLMALFSDKFPGLETCRSSDPVYVYGPRGCGKSTVFRSLALRTILQSDDPREDLKKIPFIGIYVSCTNELRSRFWLFTEEDFERLEPLIVRFFNLVLVEELTRTLTAIIEWETCEQTDFRFGVSSNAMQLVSIIRKRLELSEAPPVSDERSSMEQVRWDIRAARDETWDRILRNSAPTELPNAQLIFDLCDEMANICEIFHERKITFLLDDYSNQRISPELQRRLNQAITFARQGNPIFKVTSEYQGVELEGIQEGREVKTVNVGQEHTQLGGRRRHRFLESILQARFRHLKIDCAIDDVLPPSGIGPTHPLAIEIKKGAQNNSFHYHGIDTINDICSGDFAMALDLIRKIFDRAKADWRAPPTPIPIQTQHAAISSVAESELQKIRYLSPMGQEKFTVVERLCWFARECVLTRETKRGNRMVPLIKIHLDVSESAIRGLREINGDYGELFDDLVRKGVLFPIGGSQDMDGHEGTLRFQIRRILLTRYPAPLGRRTAIRVIDEQKLLHLLTEPKSFLKAELQAGDNRTMDLLEGVH